jgi:hypothetical protein
MQKFDAGIAQSAYVTQGFSPVAFAAGTDGTVGTVKKRGQRGARDLHLHQGHVLVSVNKLM